MRNVHGISELNRIAKIIHSFSLSTQLKPNAMIGQTFHGHKTYTDDVFIQIYYILHILYI